ncbi:MAG: UDP-N-acetylmuramate--L-alanine ligase [Chitinophagaceae bacterium]
MREQLNIQAIINSPSKAVYFIGIGGIGMSAIARYFHSLNINVSGYDKTPTGLTHELESEGIAVHYTDDIALIPKNVALVVYTPAVPQEHTELNFYRDNNYPIAKRSEVLGAITEHTQNICIAGTHGKTTTSTMIAHILRDSGYGCNAFLGGISVNYNTNFWSSKNAVSVVEADEYDRSFLKLSPDTAVITSMDADHLDIYGDEATMQDAFVEFGNKVKEAGLLINKFGLPRMREVKRSKWSYSLQNSSADIFASNIKIENGGYDYDVQLKDTAIAGLRLNIGGMHNVENSVVAVAVAHSLDINAEKIKSAVASFKGVKRRFEYIIAPQPQQQGGYVYPVFIDDYAHHPEELAALLKSARSLFPQRRLTVVFQPHLYTRTRDLANGFANSLSIADNVILLPIYPARELAVEGVSSELILSKITSENKQLLTKEGLLQWMQQHQFNKEFGEVIITAGAGDIDALVQPLKQIIEKA